MQKKYSSLEKFKNLLSAVFEKIIPMPVHEVDSLSYWRAKILFSMIFSGVLLGLFVVIPVVPMAIENKLWGLLFFDGLFLVISVLLLILPNIKYVIRATITLFVTYCVGCIVIISVGPLSGGPAWLFCFAVISGILLGYRAAVLAIFINTVTLLILGLLILNQKGGLSFPFFASGQLMFIAGFNFIFLNSVVAISVSVLVKGLTRLHDREKRITSSLKKEQVRLIDTKNELEKEFQKNKQTEHALRESERKYKHFFNYSPAGMYEIDFVKSKFTNVNKVMCTYSGYSESEFLAINPFDFLTRESKKLFIQEFKKLLSGDEISDNPEYTAINREGERINVILKSDFIYENGRLRGARVVVHDITRRKQAEEEKIRTQKIAGEQKKLALVGQIAGKMAHDFNNVLGIIMGNTELSLLDCKDSEIRKTLQLIFEQTLRGKNLTKNLVAFAKDQEPKQEFFNVDDKIDLVLNLMRKDLDGIEIIRESMEDIPQLLADHGMIEHTLVNLLQNSIHAITMVDIPKIIIKTYSTISKIYIEIADNGCGIPKEEIENIFEPSFTLKGVKDVSGSYKTGIKGTGYGLANVKKYIEQHMGIVSVDSEQGMGTKFTIRLPIIKKGLTTEEKAEINKEISHFEKYILLVEDEEPVSDIQYRVLTQDPCNHKVDIAVDGQAAIELLNKNKYDFISLDYILPGNLNGIDVYNHVRETSKTTPILFISGNLEFLESVKTLKQKDAYIDHLSKPCLNKDYLSSINKLLEKATSV
ncbi:MAG: PAS domain S-box protein [Desulfobacteraceae bacterium]|nr:PAS domain S-box protein [Desulfobacteraceae bacterium]